jgi:hypothetical protein
MIFSACVGNPDSGTQFIPYQTAKDFRKKIAHMGSTQHHPK